MTARKENDIFYFINCGDVEGVKKLKDTKKSTKSNGGYTPYLWACYTGQLEIVKLFGSPTSKDLYANGQNALIVATQQNQIKVVNYLLKVVKMDPDSSDSGEMHAIHYAARDGSFQCLCSLIQNGAKINPRASEDILPIHLAVQNGHIKCVQYLLESGADDTRKMARKSLLDIAVERKLSDMIVLLRSWPQKKHDYFTRALRYLNENKLDDLQTEVFLHSSILNFVDGEDTLLLAAIHKNDFLAVQFLVESGANVNLRNAKKRSPFDESLKNRDKIIFNYLKSKGAVKARQ